MLDYLFSAEFPSWQEEANCKDEATELFYGFPQERGGYTQNLLTPNQIKKAKVICSECPVRKECFNWAMKEEEPFGIWGGVTPSERKRIILGQESAQRLWLQADRKFSKGQA